MIHMMTAGQVLNALGEVQVSGEDSDRKIIPTHQLDDDIRQAAIALKPVLLQLLDLEGRMDRGRTEYLLPIEDEEQRLVQAERERRQRGQTVQPRPNLMDGPRYMKWFTRFEELLREYERLSETKGTVAQAAIFDEKGQVD